MATTSRLGLYRPIGTLRATANAGGTTTTLICANAATNLAIGDRFRLFTSDDVDKEDTIFTVTNVVVAGSTTVTFTPAASASTASTNRAYDGEIIDVTTAISNQMETLDLATICEFCTSSTRPSTGLYTGKLIYETDTKNIMRYSGSTWTIVQNQNFPRGAVGYATTSANGTTLANGVEAMIAFPVTFTAYADRKYLITAGGFSESVTSPDITGATRSRWAIGPTVTTSGTLISAKGADANDNSVTNGNTSWNHITEFTPGVTGQITVGIGLVNGNSAGAETMRATSYQYLAVEDIGAA